MAKQSDALKPVVHFSIESSIHSAPAKDHIAICSEQPGKEIRYQNVSCLFSLFKEPGTPGNEWSSSDVLSSMLKYTDMTGKS